VATCIIDGEAIGDQACLSWKRRKCEDKYARTSPTCSACVYPPQVASMPLQASLCPLSTDVRCPRTFSVDTKSAVSSRVNWLIWSTMVAILGFVGAAASDCHLRCILCFVAPIVGRTYVDCFVVQIQRLSARDAGAAIVLEEEGRNR
jgi:hypothetical protein